MRKFAVALVVGLVTVAMFGGVASAAGNGYGKAIKDATGSTYGQLKNAAWDSEHASPPAMGAKAFFESHLD